MYEKVLTRKLQVIGYPEWRQIIITNDNKIDENRVGDAVYWLEAVVIRFYSVDQRDASLKPNPSLPSSTWISTCFTSYLRDLGYPRVDRLPLNAAHALDWLLTYAIDLEYQDNAERYNAVQLDNEGDEEGSSSSSNNNKNNTDSTSMEQQQLNPFASSNAEIRHILHNLASCFGLSDVSSMAGENESEALWIGLYHVIRRRYTTSAILDATHHSRGNRRSTEEHLDSIHGDVSSLLDVFPPGFSTASFHLDQVTTVLRLLYMHDLKQLQSDINRLVAELQLVTASPQTDVSLGQVGRS